MIELICWRCGREGHVPDNFAGRKVTCKRCRYVVQVPDSVTDEVDVTVWTPAIDPASEADTKEFEIPCLSGFQYR
jgi:hypothetical protein